MDGWMDGWIYTHMHIHVHDHACVCVYVCMWMETHTSVRTLRICMYFLAHVDACMYLLRCMYMSCGMCSSQKLTFLSRDFCCTFRGAFGSIFLQGFLFFFTLTKD